MPDNLRILVVEPYLGGSHRAWAEGYARHSYHQVDLLTLPARFWRWRMQGGAATLAERFRRREVQPDLLLVSDMLNLPVFLGLTRDVLGHVPIALYCHENQLTYPLQQGQKRDLTYAMINWLSMLAADHVFFNSHYHMDNWFDHVPRLLKHFPDYTHVHRIDGVRAKATVLPVGCDLCRLDEVEARRADQNAPLILWNQRWEYDKNPKVFFQALDNLVARGMPFRLALAGSNVHQQPEEFEAARARLGERVVHYGRADAVTYMRLLRNSDIVVSTALHEFFGIAIVEAIYGGCFPVLPKRLAYPELLPPDYHDACLYEGDEGLVSRLEWALTHANAARKIGTTLHRAVARFDWKYVAPDYDIAMKQLVNAEELIHG